MLLCPAVLDQVSHVVHLAGVAPAFGRRISDGNKSKQRVMLYSPRVLRKGREGKGAALQKLGYMRGQGPSQSIKKTKDRVAIPDSSISGS